MKGKPLFDLARSLGYRIELDGSIRGARGEIIEGSLHHTGYRHFLFRDPTHHNRTPARIKVHRFQAYQKFGDAIFEKGIVVRHKDNDKMNNAWDNILIGTPTDNCMDNPKEQRVARATHAASFVRRFSDEDIVKMRMLRDVKKMTYKAIALEMGIKSKGHVCQILKGELYRQITA